MFEQQGTHQRPLQLDTVVSEEKGTATT